MVLPLTSGTTAGRRLLLAAAYYRLRTTVRLLLAAHCRIPLADFYWLPTPTLGRLLPTGDSRPANTGCLHGPTSKNRQPPPGRLLLQCYYYCYYDCCYYGYYYGHHYKYYYDYYYSSCYEYYY